MPRELHSCSTCSRRFRSPERFHTHLHEGCPATRLALPPALATDLDDSGRYETSILERGLGTAANILRIAWRNSSLPQPDIRLILQHNGPLVLRALQRLSGAEREHHARLCYHVQVEMRRALQTDEGKSKATYESIHPFFNSKMGTVHLGPQAGGGL